MLTCPYCNLELSAENVQEGQCPKCQGSLSLPEADANSETISDSLPDITKSEDTQAQAKTNPP